MNKLNVLYEDNHIIVAVKPANIPSQADIRGDIDMLTMVKEYVKKTEDENTQLLDLQRRYRKGEIGDNDLTEEQIEALCDLYDRQIISLKKSIEAKQQQITEYKKANGIS